MIRLIPVAQLQPSQITSLDRVVFGGTFDPIHQGHVSVLQTLKKLFSITFVAPTEANPWKSDLPTTLKQRIEMIELVLNYENLNSGIEILSHPYRFSEEIVDLLRPQVQGQLYWAVGADSADTVKDWRNWESKRVPVLVLPVEIHTHAIEVREGKCRPHPAIADYVESHELYRALS